MMILFGSNVSYYHPTTKNEMISHLWKIHQESHSSYQQSNWLMAKWLEAGNAHEKARNQVNKY